VTAPLRIAIPIHSFEPGGVERVALNLAAAWQADGADVKVLLGRSQGAMRDTAPKLDYVLRPEPIPTAAFETLWMIWAAWRWLRRNRVDVLFAAGNTYAIVGIALKLLLGRRCPPIVIKISNDLARRDLPAPARWVYRLWLRIQGRWLDCFVGMAQPMRAEIAGATKVCDDRIAVIEDPSLEAAQFAALSAIPRSDAVPRAPLYVAVGRLSGQKNFALLLRAFARLDDPAGRLVIVGEGGDRTKLERLASGLGIADRISLPGHSDPQRHLAAASAFVLSSDYEGVPAVVIEALAAGLPIAGTDCSVSMQALTGHGAFARLVQTGDAAALAGAIEQVLTMPFDPAAARASTRPFTISAAAPRYLALFARVAAR
jgi:glycosyltransferase involved in cell wall biosynthesis